jgi:hypothetical protein
LLHFRRSGVPAGWALRESQSGVLTQGRKLPKWPTVDAAKGARPVPLPLRPEPRRVELRRTYDHLARGVEDAIAAAFDPDRLAELKARGAALDVPGAVSYLSTEVDRILAGGGPAGWARISKTPRLH